MDLAGEEILRGIPNLPRRYSGIGVQKKIPFVRDLGEVDRSFRFKNLPMAEDLAWLKPQQVGEESQVRRLPVLSVRSHRIHRECSEQAGALETLEERTL